MDGISCRWNTTTGTLSRLAILVAQAELELDSPTQKQPLACASLRGPECGQEFPNMTEHLLHQELQHALPKPHKCLSCGPLVPSLQLHSCAVPPGDLDVACVGGGGADRDRPDDESPGHTPVFVESVPYVRAPCGRGFGQRQALRQHQQAGCSEPSLLAGESACGPLAHSPQSVWEAGSSKSEYSEAVAQHTLIKCSFCPKTTRSGAGLHSHMRRHHAAEHSASRKDMVRCSSQKPPSLLSCRSCEMVFKSTAMLYLHRKATHSREAASSSIPVIPKRRKKETYSCQVCSRVFLHHLSLRAHSKQHAPSHTTSIPKQGHSAEPNARHSKYSGRQPKKSHHALLSIRRASVGPKTSGRRMESLDEETDLRSSRDMRTVEEEADREFPCPSCSKVFSLQSELWNHAELHQSTAQWRQCSVCLQEVDTSDESGSEKRRLNHCVPCQRVFPALDAFLVHCQDHLRVKVEEDKAAEAYAFQSKSHN